MNREDFLRSLSMPVDDYAALRKTEEAVKAKTAQPKNENVMPWTELGEEGQLAVDVFETKDAVIITAAVAGVRPDDLDVAVTGDVVTIRGKRQDEHAVSERNFFYRECYFGSFSRTVILPVHIAADRAEATIRNGLLTLRIPKAVNEMRVPVIERD